MLYPVELRGRYKGSILTELGNSVKACCVKLLHTALDTTRQIVSNAFALCIWKPSIMVKFALRHRHRSLKQVLPLSTLYGLLGLALCTTAHAGLTFSLDRPQATSGETIKVDGLFFNDQDNTTSWVAPEQIVLQWRSPDGQAVRTAATLDGRPGTITLPLNNYARVSWSATVPAGLTGLQAISVEGYPALLALDTSSVADSLIAARPANVPLQDAASPSMGNRFAATSGGISMDTGPAPLAAVATTGEPVSASTERFLSAFSAHDPIYFALGARGGLHARFQLSFRYRLFNPVGEKRPFLDNLYLGYTQTSLWDLSSDSSPFVDTRYNPSLFWRSERLTESSDKRWGLGLSTGVEHASNGRDGPESRSLNDVFIQPILQYRFGSNVLSFQPRLKQYFKIAEENRDYKHYAGRVDWRLRWARDDSLVVNMLYRQGRGSHRSTEIDASWPLHRLWAGMNGYLFLQYFSGYGETLLGYNEREKSQVRLGIAIVP